MKPHFLN